MNAKKNAVEHRMYYYTSTVPRISIAGMLIGDEVHMGAVACSEKDNFNKSIGRGKATAVALSAAPSRVMKIQDRLAVTKEFSEQAKELAVIVAEQYAKKKEIHEERVRKSSSPVF